MRIQSINYGQNASNNSTKGAIGKSNPSFSARLDMSKALRQKLGLSGDEMISIDKKFRDLTKTGDVLDCSLFKLQVTPYTTEFVNKVKDISAVILPHEMVGGKYLLKNGAKEVNTINLYKNANSDKVMDGLLRAEERLPLGEQKTHLQVNRLQKNTPEHILDQLVSAFNQLKENLVEPKSIIV